MAFLGRGIMYQKEYRDHELRIVMVVQCGIYIVSFYYKLGPDCLYNMAFGIWQIDLVKM